MSQNIVFLFKDSNGDRDAIILEVDHDNPNMMDRYSLLAKATTGVANYEADPTTTCVSREDHVERVLIAAGYRISQPLTNWLTLEVD